MKKILSVFVIFILIIQSVVLASFSDVSTSHWAYVPISEMQNNGILNGYEDGTFKPDNEITRAEFCKIMVLVFKLNTDINLSNVKYADVDTHWAKDYIKYVSSYMDYEIDEGRYYFNPNKEAVREEVAVSLVKALGLENEKYNENRINMFSDKDEISEPSRKYIAIAIEKGLIHGFDDGTFKPADYLTRAQVSQLVKNGYDMQAEEEKQKEEENKSNNKSSGGGGSSSSGGAGSSSGGTKQDSSSKSDKEEQITTKVEDKKEEPTTIQEEDKKEEQTTTPVEDKKEEQTTTSVEDKKEEQTTTPVEDVKEEQVTTPTEEKEESNQTVDEDDLGVSSETTQEEIDEDIDENATTEELKEEQEIENEEESDELLEEKPTEATQEPQTISEVSVEVTPNRDRIHFISHQVGNDKPHKTGDAILLESDGHYAMIDLGNYYYKIGDHIVSYLKSLGITKLDFILFTHMHSDHTTHFERIIKSGIKVDRILIKTINNSEYQKNYVPNLNSNGIDKGLGTQKEGTPYTVMNRALAQYRRIIYVAKYGAYKDNVGEIVYVNKENEEEPTYTLGSMKLKLFNARLNVNHQLQENFNSIYTLIKVNGHRIFLTGDAYDTKQLNAIAKRVQKVDVFKVPHHGGVNTALMTKKYTGDKIDENGTAVKSTAISYLKPDYNIITSSTDEIKAIRKEGNIPNGKMAVDVLTTGTKMFVDYNKNALIIDFTEDKITFKRV